MKSAFVHLKPARKALIEPTNGINVLVFHETWRARTPFVANLNSLKLVDILLVHPWDARPILFFFLT